MNGQGVPADPDYAIGLLHRAAELNEPYALYVLGSMYVEGVYVDHDLDSGVYYVAQAAYFGQRRAMALLGIVIQGKSNDPDRLVKSAFHFRRAIAAGCNDVDHLLAQLTPARRCTQVTPVAPIMLLVLSLRRYSLDAI